MVNAPLYMRHSVRSCYVVYSSVPNRSRAALFVLFTFCRTATLNRDLLYIATLIGDVKICAKTQKQHDMQCKWITPNFGGYYRVMECSRKISMVPILMYFFSAFHFCYCHLCTGFSLLSKDVNVKLCQFSEITTTPVNQGCAIQIPGSI